MGVGSIGMITDSWKVNKGKEEVVSKTGTHTIQVVYTDASCALRPMTVEGSSPDTKLVLFGLH